MAAARAVGVHLVSACGEHGSCGRCRIRVASGPVNQPSAAEREQLDAGELARGVRLACQAVVRGDVSIDIPASSLTAAQRLQLEGEERVLTPDPAVVGRDVVVEPPTLHDLRSDAGRLLEALDGEARSVALPALRQLPERLREGDGWSVRVGMQRETGEVIAVLPPGRPLLGLAVDLGTTKLAAYLVELSSGRTLARRGMMNSQIPHGEDVLNRIAYANRGPAERRMLQSEAVGAIGKLVEELCAEADAVREDVVDCVIVGNTAMHHLVCGLPVRQLGSAPYVPATTDAVLARAADIGLALAPGATLYLPPCIAGYVGADHVAVLVETELGDEAGTRLALDIGTNTEVSIAHEGRVWSCSTASGPAFEGAHISAGMRAAPGAIEHAYYAGGSFHVQTVEDRPAVGLCGSGILDVVAEGVRAGIIGRRGGLQRSHPLVRGENGAFACVLVPASETAVLEDIVLTRADVGEVQLAKAAIRAGTQLLFEAAGVEVADVDEVIVAGAFGTYLDVRSAIRVGLLPAVAPERVRQVGNAAGAGARRLLVSRAARAAAHQAALRTQYIELTTHPAFADRFAEATTFERYEHDND
jgi:uncharacterized 2Fe-2S/4Fe-4S cluster protein (DUF4445 family)